MLFVDLLTRPGHQGEALREPRLRNHLRISIILLLRQHVFHSQCLRWLGGGIHTIRSLIVRTGQMALNTASALGC